MNLMELYAEIPEKATNAGPTYECKLCGEEFHIVLAGTWAPGERAPSVAEQYEQLNWHQLLFHSLEERQELAASEPSGDRMLAVSYVLTLTGEGGTVVLQYDGSGVWRRCFNDLNDTYVSAENLASEREIPTPFLLGLWRTLSLTLSALSAAHPMEQR
jgi:hypothetical protein